MPTELSIYSLCNTSKFNCVDNSSLSIIERIETYLSTEPVFQKKGKKSIFRQAEHVHIYERSGVAHIGTKKRLLDWLFERISAPSTLPYFLNNSVFDESNQFALNGFLATIFYNITNVLYTYVTSFLEHIQNNVLAVGFFESERFRGYGLNVGSVLYNRNLRRNILYRFDFVYFKKSL